MNRGIMKALLAGVLLFGLIAIAGAEEGKVYSDFDLENQKPGNRIERPAEKATNYNVSSQAKDNDADAKVWCEKGRILLDRVDTAARNVARTSRTAPSSTAIYNSRGNPIITSVSADAAIADNIARNELDEAKKAWWKLEDDAHRQGIPAGWLRCNY